MLYELAKLVKMTRIKRSEITKKPVLILEFWGSYANFVGRQVRVGGVVMGVGWDERWSVTNTFVRVSLSLESRSRKLIENISLLLLVNFNSFFSLEQETVRHSRYMI